MTASDDPTGGGCVFTTGDGALWVFTTSGNPVVLDNIKNPRFAVTMWAEGGEVNANQTNNNGEAMRPSTEGDYPTTTNLKNPAGDDALPKEGRYYSAATLLHDSTDDIIKGTHKQESPFAAATAD